PVFVLLSRALFGAIQELGRLKEHFENELNTIAKVVAALDEFSRALEQLGEPLSLFGAWRTPIGPKDDALEEIVAAFVRGRATHEGVERRIALHCVERQFFCRDDDF